MQIPNALLVFLAGTLEAMTQELPKARIAELAAPISAELDCIYCPSPRPIRGFAPTEPVHL